MARHPIHYLDNGSTVVHLPRELDDVDHINVYTDDELDDIARSIVGLFFGTHTDVVQSRALAAVHRRFRGTAPDTSVDGVRPDDRADMQPAADNR